MRYTNTMKKRLQKRKGAGQPQMPADQKCVKTSFALTQPALVKIDRRATRNKCSRSDVVQQWAEAIRE